MPVMFTFPFTTCEKPLSSRKAWWIPQQTFSFAVNVIAVACLVLSAVFLVQDKFWGARVFLISVALFEGLHAFSHHTHLEAYPRVQVTTVHFAIYAVAASFILAASELSGNAGMYQWGSALIAFAVALDILVFLFVGDIWTVLSGLLVTGAAFSTQAHKIGVTRSGNTNILVKPLLWGFVACMALMLALLFNEKVNCKIMMERKVMPYHAMQEVVGVAALGFLTAAIVVWSLQDY